MTALPALQQTGHRQCERPAADGRDRDVGVGHRFAHQRHRLGLAEPGQQDGDRVDFVGIPIDWARRARNDDEPGLGRIELRGGLQHQAAGATDHRPRPFRGHEFDLQLTADRLAARGEHFERRDDVEWVEPVEQHDLCIHVDIVGKATASG